MISKNINLSGKLVKVYGDEKDRYFNQYVVENQRFFDTPIVFGEKFFKEDEIIIDIGANIGLITLDYSILSPKGKIIGIEASPLISKIAKSTISKNHRKNVKFINIALSNKEGSLLFKENPEFLAGSQVTDKVNENSVSVKCTTLDKLVESLNLPKVSYLKIDVEGFEKEVLEGGLKTIIKYKPNCLIEFNSYAMIMTRKIFPEDFLKYLCEIYPNRFYFNRNTGGIDKLNNENDVTNFLNVNLLTGCVDDLFLSFQDILPNPSTNFINKTYES